MNNFLTRLVTRSSTKFQSQAGSSTLVKPRIGSRFESGTGLSSEPYQTAEVDDNRHYPRATDNELQPQNQRADDLSGQQASTSVKNNNPVPENSEYKTNKLNEVTPLEQSVNNDPVDRTTRAPTIAKANEVMTPDTLPVNTKSASTVSSLDGGVDRNTTEIEGNTTHPERSGRSLSDQIPQTSKPDNDISEPAPTVSSSSNPGRPVLTPEISTQIVQTKAFETNTGSMVAKANTSDTIKPSRPGLSGPNRHEQFDPLSESISNDLPATPDQFTARDNSAQIAEQDLSSTQQNTQTRVTSVINTRINLLDSRESTQSSAVFSESSKPGTPIIHSNDLGKHNTDPAGRNSMSPFAPHAQANETAQPPIVKVSIGRIEIRATTPSPQPVAAAQRPRRGPAVSLGDYLKSKGG